MQSTTGTSFSANQFSDYDSTFESTAKAEGQYAVSAEKLRKNEFIILQDNPCYITSVNKINNPQKPCVELMATDIFSGKTYTERLPATEQVQALLIDKFTLDILDIQQEGDGYELDLMDENTNTFKTTLYVRHDDAELKRNILDAFDKAEDAVAVCALYIKGKYCITSFQLKPVQVANY